MSAVPGNLLPVPEPAPLFGPKQRAILLNPVLLNNPIGVQVLGICSAPARCWDCLLYTSRCV